MKPAADPNAASGESLDIEKILDEFERSVKQDRRPPCDRDGASPRTALRRAHDVEPWRRQRARARS